MPLFIQGNSLLYAWVFVTGKRGIFDGTVENIHLHWKYRELVKLLVERKSFPQVKHIAIALEAESGGVLVTVDKTMKGHVIILYRGKNYQPPVAFRPKNLLSRRQALARSIELQRREVILYTVFIFLLSCYFFALVILYTVLGDLLTLRDVPFCNFLNNDFLLNHLQALKHHISDLTVKIEKLKSELV